LPGVFFTHRATGRRVPSRRWVAVPRAGGAGLDGGRPHRHPGACPLAAGRRAARGASQPTLVRVLQRGIHAVLPPVGSEARPGARASRWSTLVRSRIRRAAVPGRVRCSPPAHFFPGAERFPPPHWVTKPGTGPPPRDQADHADDQRPRDAGPAGVRPASGPTQFGRAVQGEEISRH
jgi:hypothetical protein